jgi:hypothetical protein
LSWHYALDRTDQPLVCLLFASSSRGAPRSSRDPGLCDYWTNLPTTLVQWQHPRGSNSGGHSSPKYACSSSGSMEYLGTSKPTPPAVTQTACTGPPVHSAHEIPSAPAVRRQPPSSRQSSNSSIWSSHLKLFNSRRHD